MKKFQNKPFVMLGVNSDKDRNALKKVITKEKLNWRSWWDDGRIDGPIHQQWQIEMRPGIHILDAKGIIRHRNLDPDKVDEALAAVLREIEK